MVTTARRLDERRAALLRGLAESSRLRILDVLREGERTVCDIAKAAGLSQPNTSNHLACLLGCGLVVRERRGRFVSYRLRDERVEVLLGLATDIAREASVTGDAACCPICGSQSW